MARIEGRRDRYHHGDLRNALVRAATDLAADGGPEAVVLRAAARRVGVSPTAAYRHFTGQSDLLDVVKAGAQESLAHSMEEALAECGAAEAAAPQEAALLRAKAVGRGYLRYAFAQPGLFRTGFCHIDPPPAPPAEASPAGAPAGEPSAARPGAGEPSAARPGAGEPSPAEPGPGEPPPTTGVHPDPDHPDPVHPASAGLRPDGTGEGFRSYDLLSRVLDGLLDAGLMPPARRRGAEIPFWSTVHGFAMLVLDGPLDGLRGDALHQTVEHLLDVLVTGLCA